MSWRRKLVITVAALVFLGGATGGIIAFWLDSGRHMVHPKNWGTVVPGQIYRSGQIHERIIEDVLREHEIEVIVDLTQDDPADETQETERLAAEALGIRKVDLVALDGYGVGAPGDYIVALQEMARARKNGTKLLIHCAGGSERTGGTCAMYRILYEGWDGQQAWAEYLSYRKDPPENDHLKNFVNQHMEAIAERLVQSGDLEQQPAELPHFGPPPEAKEP